MPGVYEVKLVLLFPLIEYFENNESSRPPVRLLINQQIAAVFNDFSTCGTEQIDIP